MSTFYMIFVFGLKPFEDNMDNLMEKFNESIIYSTIMCQYVLANPAVSYRMKMASESIYGILCITALIGNFSIQAKYIYDQI